MSEKHTEKVGSVFSAAEKEGDSAGEELIDSLAELSLSSGNAAPIPTSITDELTYVSIDVEAAAVGRSHAYSDRAPCWVAVVDSEGKELLNIVIDVPNMISPLTKVTGLTAAEIHAGVPLVDALDQVHSLLRTLSTNVTLVGQSVQGDIDWMQLEKGVHYNAVVDLSESFKVWNPRYGTWMFFSLAKAAHGLLGVSMHGASKHSPVVDAQVSMRLYMEHVSIPSKLQTSKNKLAQMTFKKQFPRELMANFHERTIDGCCGYGFDPAKCICGAPTLRDTALGSSSR